MTIESAGEESATLFVIDVDGIVERSPLSFLEFGADGRPLYELRRLYTGATNHDVPTEAIIARLQPGASSAPHRHMGYELIYVIEGGFETEHGVFGKNSVVLMKPDTVHKTISAKGCLALVIRDKPFCEP